MNRENEIFEKEMLGKTLREMFFELNGDGGEISRNQR